MITDRVGRHELPLPIYHNFNKICDIQGYFFFNQNTRNSKTFFLPAEKKSHFSARDGAFCPITEAYVTSTVLLHCPTQDEIRAVDSQSDLRIFFRYDYGVKSYLFISNRTRVSRLSDFKVTRKGTPSMRTPSAPSSSLSPSLFEPATQTKYAFSRYIAWMFLGTKSVFHFLLQNRKTNG